MKTGRTALDFCKALDIRKALDFCKTPNIRGILLTLDSRNRTHRVGKARKDKAGRPVLDVEEVTVSLNTNVRA